MKIIESYMTKNPCYKLGQTMTIKGLFIHSVGCPQPKAKAFIDSENVATAGAAVHAVLQPDGTVYQGLPWNYRGWHCGGSGNDHYIGVEMSEPSTIKYVGGATWVETGDGKNTKAHVLGTYKVAVELFAYLCEKYKLNPLTDGVILSHSEGHKRGMASNHGDVEHLWNKFGLTMVQFRKDIKAKMNENSKKDEPKVEKEIYRVRKSWADSKSQIGAYADLANAKKVCKAGYSVFNNAGKAVYTVTAKETFKAYSLIVTTPLKIHKEATLESATNGVCYKGTYTITAEKTDATTKVKMGKLKSGAGWISLVSDYSHKA